MFRHFCSQLQRRFRDLPMRLNLLLLRPCEHVGAAIVQRLQRVTIVELDRQ